MIVNDGSKVDDFNVVFLRKNVVEGTVKILDNDVFGNVVVFFSNDEIRRCTATNSFPKFIK